MLSLSILINKVKIKGPKRKLTTRLITTLFIVTLLCTTVFHALAYRNIQKEQRRNELILLTENLNIVNAYINQTANNVKGLIFSISSIEYLFSTEKETAIKTLKSIEAYQAGLVKSIYIRNDNGDIFTGTNQYIYEIMGNPALNDILDDDSPLKNTIKYSDLYHSTTSGNTICIYRLMEGNRSVAVELDLTMFGQELMNMLIADYRSYAIFSKNHETLLCDQKSSDLLPIIKNSFPPKINYEELLKTPEININEGGILLNSDKYRITTDDNFFEFEVHIICKNELFLNSIKNAYFNSYISSIAFIIALFLCYIGSILILMKPIRYLGKHMVQIETESDLKEIDAFYDDEIGNLCKAYNTMIHNMQSMIQNLKEAEEAKKEYELKMLRSQIGPHFLYNTLMCISSLSRQGRTQEVSSSISNLIKLLTLVFDKSGEAIPLRQELDGITSYIAIQKMRYGDIFDVTIYAEEKLLSCHCLKLTLQPIVENAIFHGILPQEKRGKIVIKIREKADSILLLVGDNGAGIPRSSFNDILNGNSDKAIHDRLSNIGLANVHQRIQLHFGNEYGIKIMSKLNTGTIMQIKIPKN